jgi:hypothetical protein
MTKTSCKETTLISKINKTCANLNLDIIKQYWYGSEVMRIADLSALLRSSSPRTNRASEEKLVLINYVALLWRWKLPLSGIGGGYKGMAQSSRQSKGDAAVGVARETKIWMQISSTPSSNQSCVAAAVTERHKLITSALYAPWRRLLRWEHFDVCGYI